MGKTGSRLRAACLTPMLLWAIAPVPALAAPASSHRSTWDLARFTWLRLRPRETGALPNQHPGQLDAQAVLAMLGGVRAVTVDGEEALFAPAELAALAGPLVEALNGADPGEDLLLLSGHKRGAGFFAAPTAVVARLFLQEGGLNLIVQNARLDDLGRYTPQSDWPQYDYGSRSKPGKAVLSAPGATQRRSDWLRLPLPAARPVAAPSAVAAPLPAAVAAPVSAPVAMVAAPPQATPVYADQAERLRGLKRLREEGLLSEAEYELKRQEILKTL